VSGYEEILRSVIILEQQLKNAKLDYERNTIDVESLKNNVFRGIKEREGSNLQSIFTFKRAIIITFIAVFVLAISGFASASFVKEYEKPEYMVKWRKIMSVPYEQYVANNFKSTIPQIAIDEALSYKTVREEARPDGTYEVVKENNMVLIYSSNPLDGKATVIDILFVVQIKDL
jgi:hypothetical protein